MSRRLPSSRGTGPQPTPSGAPGQTDQFQSTQASARGRLISTGRPRQVGHRASPTRCEQLPEPPIGIAEVRSGPDRVRLNPGPAERWQRRLAGPSASAGQPARRGKVLADLPDRVRDLGGIGHQNRLTRADHLVTAGGLRTGHRPRDRREHPMVLRRSRGGISRPRPQSRLDHHGALALSLIHI